MRILSQDIQKRLAELDFEISRRRVEIRQTFEDAELLSRIGYASEARLVEIVDERTLAENALANLLKEHDELEGDHKWLI